MFTFLIGGARSGKSSLAVQLAAAHQQATGEDIVVIATAPRIEGDDDLDARIETHRGERPSGWLTIEEPHDLAGALDRCGGAFVILDCLTLWVSNALWRGDDIGTVETQAHRAASFAATRGASTVVVSNEVGLGIVPASADTRAYRDLLGRVNTSWAAMADRSLLMVAGRALALHEPAGLL